MMPTECTEGERNVAGSSHERHPKKQVVIGRELERRINSADRLVELAAPETGILQRRPTAIKHRRAEIGNPTPAERQNTAILVDIEIIAKNHIQIFAKQSPRRIETAG